MAKRSYVTPRLVHSKTARSPWFPLAAAVGAVAGYKATTALLEDDHTQASRQSKLPEVRK